MKFVPLLLAVTLLGAVASSASAAPRSAADLCSQAKSVASSIAHSGSFTPTAGTSITSMEASLKASFTHIKAAESYILANSSGSLKTHFQHVFAFDNVVYAKLAAAHWNFVALAKDAASLEAGANKVKPDVLAIEAYFAKCKK